MHAGKHCFKHAVWPDCWMDVVMACKRTYMSDCNQVVMLAYMLECNLASRHVVMLASRLAGMKAVRHDSKMPIFTVNTEPKQCLGKTSDKNMGIFACRLGTRRWQPRWMPTRSKTGAMALSVSRNVPIGIDSITEQKPIRSAMGRRQDGDQPRGTSAKCETRKPKRQVEHLC